MLLTAQMAIAVADTVPAAHAFVLVLLLQSLTLNPVQMATVQPRIQQSPLFLRLLRMRALASKFLSLIYKCVNAKSFAFWKK